MKHDSDTAILDELRELRKLVEGIASGGGVPKRMFSLNEAAEYLGIGKTEAYNHLRKHVRTVNHGKKILVPKEELDALIEKGKRRGTLFN